MALLHYQPVVAPGATPSHYMLVLHGIFGMGRNWTTFAQQLAVTRPDWGFVLVDLRLHGHSQGFPPPHTLEACAADLHALLEHLQLPFAGVVGHSFGGKVALVFARDYGQPLEQVWVMDSTPEPRRSETDALTVLETMRGLPMPMASRSAVIRALQDEGLLLPVAQWLAMNIEARRDNQFYWRFDFDGLVALMRDFYAADLWPVVEAPPHRMQFHFVQAERSEVMSEDAKRRIEQAGQRNGRVFLHLLADSGHWVHVDNPAGLLQITTPWLEPRAP